MTNFHVPCAAEECGFPWVRDDSDGRWWTTIACLNDPACAFQYDPSRTRAYPLPLLLTIIVVSREFDPSTKLPLVKTQEKQRVYKMADDFARRLAEPGGSHGALAALESLVRGLRCHAEDSSNWNHAYAYCEALILTLSRDFEKDYDNWAYNSDPETMHQVLADLVEAMNKILVNPPIEKTKAILAADWSYLLPHIMAGNFVQFVEEEGFTEEFPNAAKKWEELIKTEH